jgi:RNA polymerase sigma-70 factor (ECF subfamily)
MTDASGKLELLGDDVKSSWHRFLDAFEPLRPELYRYCRALTHSAWDAEDLTQDTLMRAFVTLGTLFGQPPNPRAWLFRVASNLWVDGARRARLETGTELPLEASAEDADPRATRDAGRALLALAPQERVAVVLKDSFDFTLEEVAEVLGTTTGSVKSALHRGRNKLLASAPPPTGVASKSVLDAFCAAFNARDLEQLTALLLDSASVEIVGVVTEYGREAPKHPRTGSFTGSVSPITFDERGGVAPELLAGYLHGLATSEVRAYRDSWILLFWYEHSEGPAVRAVMTLESDENVVRRIRNYFFSPDVIAEICSELGLPFRVNGYAYWPQERT